MNELSEYEAMNQQYWITISGSDNWYHHHISMTLNKHVSFLYDCIIIFATFSMTEW